MHHKDTSSGWFNLHTRREDCTSLQNCRPDPPDHQTANSPWQASVRRPSFPREGTFDPAGSLLTRGSSSGELPKRERYVPQVRVSDLKIPTTDLPFPSYSRHRSPWQCDTWLRTPRSLVSVCPLSINDSRYRFVDLFNGAKASPRFLLFNLTYHFITRCFGPLDIQLSLLRMREENCATVGPLESWEMLFWSSVIPQALCFEYL